MRRAARLVAAVVLTAAAGALVPAVPASAAVCGSGTGVSVVVDFHELGGGVQSVCDADGGGMTARALFEAAGFDLEDVQRQPGFVCRINGKPSQDEDSCVNTPPAHAYWGLWWSNGESGTWTYSSEGASSLDIPEGGSVAFSWNDSSTKSPPGVAPPQHQSSSPSPGGGGTGGGGSTGAGGGGETPSGTPSSSPPSASPDGTSTPTPGEGNGQAAGRRDPAGRDDAQRSGRQGEDGQDRDEKDERSADQDGEEAATPSDAPSPDDSTVAPTADPPPTDGGGLPVWVAPTGIAVLFATAGAVALLRRRHVA